MVEMIAATVVLVACAALLLHQALPRERRASLHRAARRFGRRLAWHAGRWRGRLARRSRLEREVEREAHDAIERARRRARDADVPRNRRRDTLH